MTVRRILLLAVVGVLAGVAVWLPGRVGGGSEPDGAARPHGASSSSAAGAADVALPTAPSGSPSSSAHPSGQPSGHLSQKPAAQQSAGPSTTVPGAPSSQGAGTEILPQPASRPTQQGLPLPKRPPQGPLVTRPLPRTAYEKDAIVAGYPTALRPPAGSTVETSSVSAANETLQVALTGRCSRCDVLRHFRVALGARGFHEVDTVSVSNTPAAALQRANDSVNVTVVAQHGKTVEYAVFAVLHAGG